MEANIELQQEQSGFRATLVIPQIVTPWDGPILSFTPTFGGAQSLQEALTGLASHINACEFCNKAIFEASSR